MPISLRRARASDAPLLRHWDAQPHVIAAKGTEDWQWETELAALAPGRDPLIIELDGRPIGYVELAVPALDPTAYWGDVAAGERALDIWLGEPDLLSRGHGSEAMRQAIDRCFADPAASGLLIDPLADNTAAQRFYERLGFQFVEHRTFGDDDHCAVYRLSRADWEARRH